MALREKDDTPRGGTGAPVTRMQPVLAKAPAKKR
jgi:hypothetical protein